MATSSNPTYTPCNLLILLMTLSHVTEQNIGFVPYLRGMQVKWWGGCCIKCHLCHHHSLDCPLPCVSSIDQPPSHTHDCCYKWCSPGSIWSQFKTHHWKSSSKIQGRADGSGNYQQWILAIPCHVISLIINSFNHTNCFIESNATWNLLQLLQTSLNLLSAVWMRFFWHLAVCAWPILRCNCLIVTGYPVRQLLQALKNAGTTVTKLLSLLLLYSTPYSRPHHFNNMPLSQWLVFSNFSNPFILNFFQMRSHLSYSPT